MKSSFIHRAYLTPYIIYNNLKHPVDLHIPGIFSRMRILVLFILVLSLSASSFAQLSDTAGNKKHSPRKAAIMSACLPGLGQAYNKKYWKIPVIYAGAAVVTYLASSNAKNMNKYGDVYKNRINGDTTPVDPFPNYSDESLKELRDYYRKNLEITIIAAAGVYILNVLDATVDANFFDFDIDDNLSMKVSPVIYPLQKNSFAGLSFSFTFGRNHKHHLLKAN